MNDVLVKILCHNICVLIQSVSELRIAPLFGREIFGTIGSFVPKVAWDYDFWSNARAGVTKMRLARLPRRKAG